MVDLQTVCCMCGDVGFPDKLFRCRKCRHRFQHSYCSNYYGELPEIELCDWCQNEEKSSRTSKKPAAAIAGSIDVGSTNRSEYSGSERIKQQHHDHHHRDEGGCSDKGKSPTPSPRPTTRRYKLLKDVMC
ncbi:hypothetical protein QN277_022942 [Acacia crassicarpa]|uniref:PHD-type zinc finger plants domain-containing protein n=1 Tax=Acacia crassicarpa TaxID=499986 RepID=A0AAE1JGA4_9FABA|nr:hypothetical protein QN277_022942 [Acacia crassicarpa]